jgi:preprotein translocase subunit SecG
MGFVIGLLTVFMVLNCLLLVLLVLIQLPKKEAGAGLAFGGGATDALFGAGSGTVLTKVTKYSATVFFILALVLAIMERAYHNRSSSEFLQNLAKPGPAGLIAPPPKSAASPAAAPAGTNFHLLTAPASNPAPTHSSTSGAAPAKAEAPGK